MGQEVGRIVTGVSREIRGVVVGKFSLFFQLDDLS